MRHYTWAHVEKGSGALKMERSTTTDDSVNFDTLDAWVENAAHALTKEQKFEPVTADFKARRCGLTPPDPGFAQLTPRLLSRTFSA